MTTWCCQIVNTSTTGRRHQTCLHSQTTPPASPTLTFPTNTLWKTSTWASSALCSSVSLVRNRISPFSPPPCPCTFVFVSLKLAIVFALSKGSLDESGKQIGVHHEYVFLFGVFDENESKYKQSSVASNTHIKYTINGYAEGSLPSEYLFTRIFSSL